MTHAEMDELYELYVLDVLEFPLKSEIDEHVSTQCEYCLSHIQEASRTTAALSALAEVHQPPTSVRARILLAVKPIEPVRGQRHWVPILIAACLAMGVLLAWQTVRLTAERRQTSTERSAIETARTQTADAKLRMETVRQQAASLQTRLTAAFAESLGLRQGLLAARNKSAVTRRGLADARAENASARSETAALNTNLAASRQQAVAAQNEANALRSDVAAAQSAITAARTELTTVREELGRATAQRDTLRTAVQILSRPQTRTVSFGDNEQGPHGRVLVNRESGFVFVASGLPQVAADRTFELWLVPPKGAPRSVSLFRSDLAGSSLQVSQQGIDPSQVKAVAVSIEPAAGSPAPTTKPILVIPIG